MNIKSALILVFVSTICLLEVNSKGKVYEDVDGDNQFMSHLTPGKDI